MSFARLKGLDKGAEGEFVKLSTAVGVGASAFNALNDVKVAKAAGEAASAIRRVVEEAEIAVRPAVAVASRALAEAGKRLAEGRLIEGVGLADDEFRRAFNIAGDKRPLYFVYSVGDVEYGAVKARGVRAVAFVSGEKTLRIEILAEGVEGLATERVRALGGEWVRLATFEIDVKSGLVQLTPRVEVSARVVVEPVSAKRLSALALTDAWMGGTYLESPDPTLHLLYALAVGEATIKVAGVTFTEAGPTLHLESRAHAGRVNWLYEDVKRELGKVGMVVGAGEIRRKAKSKVVEVVGEYAGEVMRIAKEARGVEELRDELVELFDNIAKKAAEEYRHTRSEEALWRAVGAVVAKKFFAENVDDPVWWALLLLGDGVVFVRNHIIGFSAKPAEAAEAVIHIFARVMGVPLEVGRLGESAASLSRAASRAAVKRLFKRLEEARVGNVPALHLLTAVAEWWLGVGTSGSDPPKLLSLLALRELAAGKEGRWLRAWLSYEAAVTPAPEEVEKWLDGVYRVSVKPSRDPLTGAVSFDAEFEQGGERFKLHTDFTSFRLYCDSCSETSARGVLEAVAEELRPAVERLGPAAGEWPKLHWNALVLPAEVGWPMFLKLWARHNMSLRVPKEGVKELLCVEVLEARADGTAKLRLWYYKWRETRPDRPYVDVEIRPYPHKDGGIRFRGHVYANGAKGIDKEHLAEIAKLLEERGVEGVAYYEYEKKAYLQFTGAFRESVLVKVGIRPELPPGEPPAVQHMGGLRFKIGGREVEFGERAFGKTREFYAELKFPSRDEAERFASSLKAVGVYAEVAGNTVRLNSDSFFGLLAAADATPPGLTPLYRSNNLHVYASVEEGRTRFYFAVKNGGVWRVAEGLFVEKWVQLWRAERDVLEAVRNAVIKALKMLGRSAEVEEPKEKRDERGNVETYYLTLYGPHITPFLEHAAETMKAEPAEVRLEGRHIVVEVGDVKTEVEFKLLKGSEADFLLAKDVRQTLVLYKSLKALGVPVEITPGGVRVGREALWALVAIAVERDAPSALPAEVMPGVELLKVYSAGGMRIYAFKVSEEGVHYYFAVKTGQEWRAAGGKLSGGRVMIAGEAARAVAEAINAIYRERGVERRVEVRQMKDGTPYIRLTNVDLET